MVDWFIPEVTNIIKEYKIPRYNRKSYDLSFEYGGNKYIAEMDGQQHFMKNNRFYKPENDLSAQKIRDIKYTNIALENGYNFIRIDYNKYGDIKSEIIKARDNYYFSNDKLYEHIIKTIPNNGTR